MATKRDFKKNVDAIGACACQPMVEALQKADEKTQKTIEDAITKIISATAAARSNADITFDKGVNAFQNLKEYSAAKRDFYKKLFDKINNDFAKELEEALAAFNSVLSPEDKEKNKSSVKA